MLATVSVCEGVQKRLAEVIFPALWFTRILRIRYCDIEQISLQVRLDCLQFQSIAHSF